ncbi:MAG: ATP-binding protein [Lachnospiraceae bacterium]|nr:ATP-binding protein [Lachnospiraceae bacterium]
MILPNDIEQVEMEDGDYIDPEDGLIHCGICKVAKQKRLEPSMLTDGREIIVRCICKCQAESLRHRNEMEKRKEEMERIAKLRGSSLIDDRLRMAKLATFKKTRDNQKVFSIANRYVEQFEKMYENQQGIIFWGEVGTGKSYTAACIANELLEKKIPVVMTSFVKILQNIQGNQEEEKAIMARLNDVSLLIIDDLGTERDTDYALEKVYNIIDSRYRAGKPLILTTNMTIKEMQENTDIRYKRIYDRIFEMCYPVRVLGRSWREQAAERRFDKMKELLEG